MRTVLFLDIDGVFSIANTENFEERKERWPSCGVLWPIPIAMPLLRAMEDNKELYPVWMTAWDGQAIRWNMKANTKDFPVAYHLTRRQEVYAKLLFPEYEALDLAHSRYDRKLLAARYYLRKHPGKRVVWLEDGFASETKVWANDTLLVKLVDTTEANIRAYLLAEHTCPEQAARDFIERWL